MDHNSKIFGNRPITNMDHEEKRGPRIIRSDIRVHAPTCSDPSHFWTDTRTIFYIPVSGSVKNELSCYQCASSSLSECRKEEYLTPCPNDHAVDTCQSVISKRSGANLTVTKKCVLSPCFLDSEGNTALKIDDDCDTYADSFSCVFCCRGDGCNAASAPSSALQRAMIIAATCAVAISSS